MANTRPPSSNANKDPNPKKKVTKVVVEPNSSTTPLPKPAVPIVGAANRPTRTNRPPAKPAPKEKFPIFLLVGIILVFGVALVAILGLSNNSNNSSNPIPAATVNASTEPSTIPIAPDPTAKLDTFPNQGQLHIEIGAKHEAYNSNPPTSGPHYVQPLPWGVYDKPATDESTVHNLEHGGIVIQYDCTGNCTEVINQLTNYARRYKPEVFTGILLAPRSNLPDGAKIAVTAWQKRLLLKSLDTTKINEFIAANFNKAPESAG